MVESQSGNHIFGFYLCIFKRLIIKKKNKQELWTEGKEVNFFLWLYACKKMLLHLYNLMQYHTYFYN